MDRCLWRVMVAGVAAGVLVAGCGGEGGEAFTTTTAGPLGTVGETTTTAAWGEEMAPGVGALVEGSRVLLREDFQDGDTAGWVVEAGWYVLENGERRMAAAGGEAWIWYPGGLGWSRYGMRLAFIVNAGSLGVSVAAAEGGRYVVQFSEQGVHLLRDAPYGSVQALGSAQPVEAGVAHVLAVGCDGGHVQVYVDGVLLIDAVDGSPLPGGSIGLGAGAGSSVAVDNIVVAGLGGPLPQIQAVGEPADQPLPDQLADAAPEAGEVLEAEEPGDSGFPNLVVTSVTLPSGATLDEAFDVSMTVANSGEADAGPFEVLFVLDDCLARVDGVPAGGAVEVSCRWPGIPSWEGEEESLGWNAWADSGEVINEGGREDDNIIYGTVSLGEGAEGEEALPNLKLSWWDTVPSYEAVSVGETIAMTFQIEQSESAWQGHMSTFAVEVLDEDGSTVCDTTVGAPDFTGSCQLSAFEAAGERWLQLVTDSGDAVRESNEDDNSAAIWVMVVESGLAQDDLPNLWFLTLHLEPASPQEGQLYQARILLDSDSDVDLPAYTVRLFVDGVLVCSQDGRLSRGEYVCAGLTAPSSETFFDRYVRWSVQLDADNDIAESDEADNAGVGTFTLQP